MRSFRGDISGLTAGNYTPFNVKPFGVYTDLYTDNTLDGGAAGTAAVPATAVDGAYKLVCDYRPQRSTISVTLDGVAASLVEYPTSPASAGSVGINYLNGELEFHADDAEALVVATYKHLGSVLDAGNFNQLQKDLDSKSNLTKSLRVIDTSDTILLTDEVVYLDQGTAGADPTITLPDATTCVGRIFVIGAINVVSSNVHIVSSSSQDIIRSGAPEDTFIDLTSTGHTLNFVSIGSEWVAY